MARRESEKCNKKVDEAHQRSRAANEVLNSLNRWSQRIGDHFTEKRENIRNPYREQIMVYIPESKSTTGDERDQIVIQPWARGISSSGINFIYSDQIPVDRIIVCLK